MYQYFLILFVTFCVSGCVSKSLDIDETETKISKMINDFDRSYQKISIQEMTIKASEKVVTVPSFCRPKRTADGFSVMHFNLAGQPVREILEIKKAMSNAQRTIALKKLIACRVPHGTHINNWKTLSAKQLAKEILGRG